MQNYIRKNISESIAAKQLLLSDEKLTATVEQIARLCIEAYKKRNKILICGNGGSASDAQHMAGELVGRYEMERRGIPAIALSANTAVMTAVANDYQYENAFAKQVAALGNVGDILVGISTSGNSANVLRAFEEAGNREIVTVGLTGSKGGRMKACADYLLCVPSDHTPRIQEMHILLIHILCGLIERNLCESGYFRE